MASHLERLVYLNGEYMHGGEAKVSIFDRGLLFADAVYEGLGIRNGRIIDFEKHMARLKRSLGELNIPEPLSKDELQRVFSTLITKIFNGSFPPLTGPEDSTRSPLTTPPPVAR